MKLVELLARELSEWPDGCTVIWQSAMDLEIYFDGCNHKYTEGSVAADDRGYKGSHITRAQWQAERERQNGGEWKRHRGGRMPVALASRVEVKLRCGDIQQGESHEFLWRHAGCDVAANIMQYRIISQPKEEEVEVKDTTIGTISYKVEIDTSEADKAIDALTAKWEQFDGPLRWRDSIIHCQAIIEDCEREIERNIQQLADEGFMLISPITDCRATEPDACVIDWRHWQEGDIVKVVKEFDSYDIGETLVFDHHDFDDEDQPINLRGNHGSSWPETNQVEFVRRP